jgi:type I restriction enzyme R subunit
MLAHNPKSPDVAVGKWGSSARIEGVRATMSLMRDTARGARQGTKIKDRIARDQLAEMQKIIDAEKSDLFDVLAHVAYAMTPQTRAERADRAKVIISANFNEKQQAFLDCVLSHYVSVGVDEL